MPEVITRKQAKARGLSRYFTGNACKNGHMSERRTGGGNCVECQAEESRSDKRKRYQKNYRLNNKDKIRQWREENRGYFKRYREESAEMIKMRSKEWRENNKDKIFEKNRKYRMFSPEKRAAIEARRRASKLNRTLRYNEELTNFVMDECCQQAKDMKDISGITFHVDHMIPMQGKDVSGLHVWYNLQVMPASLNFEKNNSMLYTEPLEWLTEYSKRS